MRRTFLTMGTLALAATLSACGTAADTTAGDGGAAAGTCLEGTPDCDDTGVLAGAPGADRCLPEATDCDDTPGDGADVFDGDAAVANAKALLGLADTDLDPDVRVARRGEETMALTEDYVLGRLTVELDIDDMDRWIVTAVTVELPDGPETFTQYLP